MLQTGMVSITFRQLTAEKIIDLVQRAGLEGIEWGGDIHVPHGNIKKAHRVKMMTENAGIEVASYGSYYRVGCHNSDIGPFEKVLDTAVALGAPTIRVWAGNKGSDEADQELREKVVEESKEIAHMAKKEGITISFEYHGNTLTDSSESARKLLREVSHENIRSYWQPPINNTIDENLQSLKDISLWLSNVHVFYWKVTERYPLSDGEDHWIKYLKEVDKLQGERYAMLEFVKDDSPEQFLNDSRCLKEVIAMVKRGD